MVKSRLCLQCHLEPLPPHVSSPLPGQAGPGPPPTQPPHSPALPSGPLSRSPAPRRPLPYPEARGHVCSRARSSPGRCALRPPRPSPVAAVSVTSSPLSWPLCSVASCWPLCSVASCPGRSSAHTRGSGFQRPCFNFEVTRCACLWRCCLRPGVHPHPDWPRSRQAARGQEQLWRGACAGAAQTLVGWTVSSSALSLRAGVDPCLPREFVLYDGRAAPGVG